MHIPAAFSQQPAAAAVWSGNTRTPSRGLEQHARAAAAALLVNRRRWAARGIWQLSGATGRQPTWRCAVMHLPLPHARTHAHARVATHACMFTPILARNGNTALRVCRGLRQNGGVGRRRGPVRHPRGRAALPLRQAGAVGGGLLRRGKLEIPKLCCVYAQNDDNLHSIRPQRGGNRQCAAAACRKRAIGVSPYCDDHQSKPVPGFFTAPPSSSRASACAPPPPSPTPKRPPRRRPSLALQKTTRYDVQAQKTVKPLAKPYTLTYILHETPSHNLR